MADVVLVEGEDWEALYIDCESVAQDRWGSLGVSDAMEHLEGQTIESYKEVYIPGGPDGRRYPEKLEDLAPKITSKTI